MRGRAFRQGSLLVFIFHEEQPPKHSQLIEMMAKFLFMKHLLMVKVHMQAIA